LLFEFDGYSYKYLKIAFLKDFSGRFCCFLTFLLSLSSVIFYY